MNTAADVREPIGELLDQLIAEVRARGVDIRFETAPSDELRYVGLFRGQSIILYSVEDPFLALFTVAHLYGHLCQIATGDAQRTRVAGYVPSGRTLSRAELREITVYEHEAARIGRALLEQIFPVSAELDAAYARLFFADATYLLHFLTTGERGPAVFESFLIAQTGEPLITPEPRLLRASLREVRSDIVVI